MTLRPYQARALGELRRHHADRPILVIPTGGGKTHVACAVIAGATEHGRSVLFLAHRTELIEQAAARLADHGVECGIIKAGFDEDRARLVQAASVQTLVRRDMPPADVIIVDECHHAVANTYQTIIDEYPDACVIGLTATPFRLDGRGLGEIFGHIVVAATPRDLVEDGYILEPRYFVGREKPNLKGVPVRLGDYANKALGLKMSAPKLVCDVVDTWLEKAGARRTVVFAASVDHSIALVAAFRAAGVAAAHIDGTTPADERSDILGTLRAGSINVVSNYGVLLEGWDLPDLGVCVLARPTKSQCLYLQMVGRVMRAVDGKERPIVLDHARCFDEHGDPLAELDYSLDGKVKRATEDDTSMTPKVCPGCFALVERMEPTCPECGHEFKRAEREKTKAADGDMVEVGGPDDVRVVYAGILMDASRKRHAIGWARYRYRDLYGDWPSLWGTEREYYKPFGKRITTRSLEGEFGDGFEDAFARVVGCRPFEAKWGQLCKFAAHLAKTGRVYRR